LRATIAWSYDLSSGEEQELFARIAVFSGGFTLQAAEIVCDADLDTVASLLDKSLIRREGERFSMLETIREYAVERLEEAGEGDVIARRHAEYMTELAESVEFDYLGPQQAAVRERFRTEWDNVRSALAWTLESGETELGLRLVGALAMVWLDQNLAVEGERWLQAFFARPEPVDPEVRAKALMAGATVAGVRSQYELAFSRSEEALEYFRSVGSEEGIAWSLTGRAVAPLELGKPEEAGPMLEEAEALHRKLGYDAGIRRVLHLRGQQAAAVGDSERGRQLLQESADLSRARADMFSTASSTHSLGDLELAAGNLDAADENYREGLRVSWEIGSDRLVCYGVAGLAAVGAERGQAERAALLWGFAESYEKRLNFTLRRRELYADRLLEPAAAAQDRYDAGGSLDVAAAVEIALSLD
jgi:non-specific serine/threonine protein kinase